MSAAKRFVLISHPRSGSTWLAQGLAEHDNILMFGEVLNPDPETRPEGMEHGLRYETYLEQVPAPYSPTRPAAEFIEDLFALAAMTGHSSVGFKIHYEHAWDGPVWNGAWKRILADRDIHKIHLYRRDLLRAYVSLQIAVQTDQWVSTDDHPAGPRSQVRLRLSIPGFRAFVRHCRRVQALIRACAAVQPVLDLAYEDSIAVDPAQTCLSVYAWLGQPPQRVDNYIVRQEAFDVAAVVVNYAEAWDCWQGLMHAAA